MKPHPTPDQEQWRAIVQRDPRADATFVFAVRTTGVCCRPSCAARRPLRRNVEVFVDVPAAQRAGYRPCKRCRPGDREFAARRAQLVQRLCRRLEREDPAPSLTELARAAKLSPERLRRLFVAVVGVTPRDYLAQHRLGRAGAALADGRSVTDAMLDGGYSSTSRFHAATKERLGMMPKQMRAGAPGERLTWACVPCSLGAALIATTARGVAAILLGDDAEELQRDLQRRFARAELLAGDQRFVRGLQQIVAVVDGSSRADGIALDVRGTAFQQLVWAELRQLARGETIDYTELARRIGRPSAARAVASACGQNPVAVLVPCHRVVQKNGALAGYRWGVERKRRLLERERDAAE